MHYTILILFILIWIYKKKNAFPRQALSVLYNKCSSQPITSLLLMCFVVALLRFIASVKKFWAFNRFLCPFAVFAGPRCPQPQRPLRPNKVVKLNICLNLSIWRLNLNSSIFHETGTWSLRCCKFCRQSQVVNRPTLPVLLWNSPPVCGKAHFNHAYKQTDEWIIICGELQSVLTAESSHISCWCVLCLLYTVLCSWPCGGCAVHLDTLCLWLQLLTLNRATPGRRSSDRGDCSVHLHLNPSRCHDGKCGCMTQIPLLLHRHPDLFFFNPCLVLSVDYQIISLQLTCGSYKALIPLGCMCSCPCCRVDESSCQSFSTVGLVNESPDWNRNNDGNNKKRKMIIIKSLVSVKQMVMW